VEDIEQENFYFETLKNLFPDLKFDKIFPLGGKKNVLIDADTNIGDKKKVYLVDLDFDEILGIKQERENVFYLEKYSIENYLLEFNAIKKVIIEQRPKLKNEEIINIFDLDAFFGECQALFTDIICYYLTIQKHELGIINVDNDTARFCDFTIIPSCIKIQQLQLYHNQVETALIAKDQTACINAQISYFKNHFIELVDALKHIPGKYLLNFLKYRIEHLFRLSQMSLESFTFRLAKNCEFHDLMFLKQRVTSFIT